MLEIFEQFQNLLQKVSSSLWSKHFFKIKLFIENHFIICDMRSLEICSLISLGNIKGLSHKCNFDPFLVLLFVLIVLFIRTTYHVLGEKLIMCVKDHHLYQYLSYRLHSCYITKMWCPNSNKSSEVCNRPYCGGGGLHQASRFHPTLKENPTTSQLPLDLGCGFFNFNDN